MEYYVSGKKKWGDNESGGAYTTQWKVNMFCQFLMITILGTSK